VQQSVAAVVLVAGLAAILKWGRCFSRHRIFELSIHKPPLPHQQ
jgi:hypothetical protein